MRPAASWVDLPKVESDELVMLAYTSGTTSDPKGVIHDHRTMLSELRHMADYMMPEKPRLMGSPVTHATGMLGAVLGPLVTGEAIHLIDRWEPSHALEVMKELSEYIRGVVAQRTEQPSDDLISVLVAAQDGSGLSAAEMTMFVHAAARRRQRDDHESDRQRDERAAEPSVGARPRER